MDKPTTGILFISVDGRSGADRGDSRQPPFFPRDASGRRFGIGGQHIGMLSRNRQFIHKQGSHSRNATGPCRTQSPDTSPMEGSGTIPEAEEGGKSRRPRSLPFAEVLSDAAGLTNDGFQEV